MKIIRSRLLWVMLAGLTPWAQAKDYGPELLQSCARIQLKDCKMTGRKVSYEQLAKYQKAFSCIKNGSSSGDSFDVGIPLPDLGELGLTLDSNSSYSTEVCKEEVSKLNSASFMKDYSQTFDKECGRTLSGQYQQCVEAAAKLAEPQGVQTLKCSAAQSSSQIIINTRYVPGAMEGPKQYRIQSISGMSGVQCEKNAYAGVNQYASVACQLPKEYQNGNLVVKLANTVSCTVPVKMERKLELATMRQYSCANLYNKLELNGMPAVIKTLAIGQCDQCLAENLSTSIETDQRTLATRAVGCAVWAAKSLEEAKLQFCEVKSLPTDMKGIYVGAYYPPLPPLNGGSVEPQPNIQPTLPGTERGIVGGVGATVKDTEWAAALCNARPTGDVVQLQGDAWKRIPIDYLSTQQAKDPMIQNLIELIERSIQAK